MDPKDRSKVDRPLSDQSQLFIEAACELGCDESPDAFEAAVKKVARHKPSEQKPARKSKKLNLHVR